MTGASPVAPVIADSARLTPWFEANQGQLPSDVLFSGDLSNFHIYLHEDRAVLDPVGGEAEHIQLSFKGANPSPIVQGQDPTGAVSHYYPVEHGTEPIEGVPHLSTVIYRDLWPGIDLIFRINDAGYLEYDLHADEVSRLDGATIEVTGTEQIQAQADGALVFHAPRGAFRQGPPVAFSPHDPQARIPARTVTDGSILSFELETEDHDQPIIIDPVITYTSTFGGSGQDYAYDVAVDSQGNAYVTGMTTSPNFAGEKECIRTPLNPCSVNGKAYLAKFDPDGSLLWRAQFGGPLYDHGYDVALDPTETYAYVGGDNAKWNDGLIARLETDGHGGRVARISFTSAIYGLDIGPDGSVYAAARTNFAHNSNPPTFPDAFQPEPADDIDVLLIKLSPSLDEATYLTYFGGAQWETPQAVRLAPDGTLYVAGYTKGELGPGDRQTWPSPPQAMRTSRVLQAPQSSR